MECPKCGFDNPTESHFCNKCGTQIMPSAATLPYKAETAFPPTKELATGALFAGRYEVIEELGRGGMGKVYKVFDKKIKDKVALKLIKPEIASEEKTIERFSSELRLARKISHKSICRMFDIGEDDGLHFITMEYVSGEDLKSMLRMMGRLSPGQAVSIARQVGEGLAEAHRLGIVHRDLKPSNIMIDREGNVKIMDFGIARSLRTKGITGEGVVIGTPEYMSPEQVEGKDVDQRSDLYSLGIVLYEMLTGKVPFQGESPLGIALKQKTEAPPEPREINAHIPDDLARLILRCLKKEKGERYQSARQLLEELAGIEEGIPTGEKALPIKKSLTSRELTVRLRKGWKTLAGLAAVVLVGLLAVLYLSRSRPEPGQGIIKIAVLPFENQGALEDEYFADGVTDEIIARLTAVSKLGVISRNSSVQYKETTKSLKQIGEELGAEFILTGTIRWQKGAEGAGRFRITPTLSRVSDVTQMWADVYDGAMTEIFQIQSDVAKRVVSGLDVALGESEKKTLEAKPTDNAEAYGYFLQACDYMNRGTERRENLTMSIELNEKAVKLDPRFAQAYAGLARAHSHMYWLQFDRSEERAAKCKEAADRAIRLGPDLPEAHIALGIYYYHCRLDYDKALEHLSTALKERPRDSEALSYVAYVKRRQGKLDEILPIQKKALEIDPRSIQTIGGIGDTYALLREYAEAESYYLRVVALSPDYLANYISPGGSLAYLYLRWLGDTTKLRQVLNKAAGMVASADEITWLHYLRATADIFDKAYREALRQVSLMAAEALDDQFRFIPKSQLSAQVYGLMDEAQKEREHYDSARLFLEDKIKERPEDPRLYSALGIACAGLGLRDRAVLEATKATDLLPVSREFWKGIYRVRDLAQVYVMVGEYDKALDRIEYLLSIPGELSVPLLKIDPAWAPLRTLPRFQKLLQEY